MEMRLFQRNQGIITVFVILIMVPVVVFTGMFVDLSRYKFSSSQAVMAADAYGELILSEYQNVLKELYGLFAVSQDEEGLQAIKTLEKYIGYSFQPSGEEGSGLSGFMPYGKSDVKLAYKAVEGATLNNNDVLLTQIAEFMQYRIIGEVLDGSGILSCLDNFRSLDADMDAMEDIQDVGTSGTKALSKLEEYYDTLCAIDAYSDFIEGRKDSFERYSDVLKEIRESGEYADYVYYLEHEDAIKAAVEKQKRIDKEIADGETPTETMSDEEKAYAEKDMDADGYKSGIEAALNGCSDSAWEFDSEPADFANIEGYIKDLKKQADKLSEILNEIEEKVKELEGELENCSSDVRTGIREEIAGLKKIAENAHNVRDTYDKIEPMNQDIRKNRDNEEKLKEELGKLDEISGGLIEGEMEPGGRDWAESFSYEWFDFKTDNTARQFYQELQDMFKDSDGSGKGKKKEADQKIDEANKKLEDMEKKIAEDDASAKHDISSYLAKELGVVDGSVDKDVSLKLSGGLNASAGTNINVLVDRFLLASYDFGMFSSRVSGLEEPGEGIFDSKETEEPVAETGGKSAESADYSLTKVKICGDINYLYGAELEYLFGGHNRSKDNLDQTRNIICAIRMTMNFASTYTITEINNAIRTIANSLAAAVAATGFGSAVAPLIRVAVSAALRGAVAGMETYKDWELLKERKKVPLIKMNWEELSMKQEIEGFLGGKGEASGSSKKSMGIQLGYEDYLYLLMYLTVSTDTLLDRTQTLISLNVNQGMRAPEDKEKELSELKFKMQDTVTAVESSCKVKMDFVVIPENFVELYLKGTYGEAVKTKLEGEYLGYSVIRGY